MRGRPKGGTNEPRRVLGDFYTAGEGINFEWRREHIERFITEYDARRKAGQGGPEIIIGLSELFKRPQVDIAILIIDLGEREFISSKGRTHRRFFA
jgi:hypothetical protein